MHSSERLTTGRRHLRAGSVHVSELIRKQPLPFEIPSQVGDPTMPPADDADDGALDSLLDPDSQPPNSHRRPVSKGAQLAKIAGLGVASFVLCASIAYGSMISHQRREQAAPQTPPKPAVEISGEKAILPDLLNRAVPEAGSTGPKSLPGKETEATGTIENPGPGGAAAPPQRSASEAEAPSAQEPVSKTELVKEFYRLVPSLPAQAFSLLDPKLLGGTGVDKFVQSWSTISDVQVVEVREQGDDVLAVVRLLLPDGSTLRVQQLLDVANTTPQRILGAAILSAQRN